MDWDLWFFEDLEEKHELISELINDGGVCRTAPATPGLLITFQKHIALVYFVKTVWDYMFSKTLKDKQNYNWTHPDSIFKVFLCNTSFWVQDVCQINMSSDWYEVYV